MDDNDDSTVEDESSGSEQSFSETSSIESECSFDMEKMKLQLQPVINERVNAWPEKGIYLHLKTVDPSVTVEEWLQANQEHTTTKKQTRKTIISEDNKKTTIRTTEKTTTTTTTRKSFQLIRSFNDGKKEVMEITNGDNEDNAERGTMSARDKNTIKKHKRKQEKPKDQTESTSKKYTPSTATAVGTKRFALTKPPKGNIVSSNVVIPSNNVEPPEKIQKFSSDASSISNVVIPPPPTNVEPSEILTDNASIDSQNDGDVFDEIFDTSESLQHRSSKEIHQLEKRTMKILPTKNSIMKISKRIVIHSPNAGSLLGTKINSTSMRMTRKDYEKRIDPQCLRIRDETLKNESIVPINQKIVYDPPICDTIPKQSPGEDSESDDELLTSYTRTGHFLRLD